MLKDGHDDSVCVEVPVINFKPTGLDLILKAVPAADEFLSNDSLLHFHEYFV